MTCVRSLRQNKDDNVLADSISGGPVFTLAHWKKMEREAGGQGHRVVKV